MNRHHYLLIALSLTTSLLLSGCSCASGTGGLLSLSGSKVEAIESLSSSESESGESLSVDESETEIDPESEPDMSSEETGGDPDPSVSHDSSSQQSPTKKPSQPSATDPESEKETAGKSDAATEKEPETETHRETESETAKKTEAETEKQTETEQTVATVPESTGESVEKVLMYDDTIMITVDSSFIKHPDSINGFTRIRKPDKTVYHNGELIDLSGLVYWVIYRYKSYNVNSDFKVVSCTGTVQEGENAFRVSVSDFPDGAPVTITATIRFNGIRDFTQNFTVEPS